MAADWREMKLGDAIELKRGYDLPSRDRRDGPFPIVSSSGISGCHSEAKAKAPGVVIGRYGTLGEVHYITEDYWPLNTALYVRDFKGNDPRFVSYFLRSLDFTAFSDKAAVPGLNRNDLHTATVLLPPLSEQRAIAHILGTLDEKIELNRRMSETLAEMARTLLRLCVVDSPRGTWRFAPLSEWVDVFSGGTPSKTNAGLWSGTIKWISPKVMTSIHADASDEEIAEAAIGNGTRIAPRGSTLVMVRGMGLHKGVRVSQAREDVAFSQDVKALVPKLVHKDLLFFAVLNAQEQLLERVESSGHGTGKLPSELLMGLQVTMPDRPTQERLAPHFTALNDRIAVNRRQARELSRLREALLPRLLSGDLRGCRVESEEGANELNGPGCHASKRT